MEDQKKAVVSEIHPFGEWVLIKPVPPESTLSVGGVKIDIPDSAQEKPQKGILESVGEGVSEARKSRIGSKVLYKKNAGVPISENGIDYLLMHQDNVFSKI